MFDEADKDAMVTALLLDGVEGEVAKMYAARVVGSAKAETFYEVYGRGSTTNTSIHRWLQECLKMVECT